MCTASRLWIGIGARALELFLLMQEHLGSQSDHHQRHPTNSYQEYNEYGLHNGRIRTFSLFDATHTATLYYVATQQNHLPKPPLEQCMVQNMVFPEQRPVA